MEKIGRVLCIIPVMQGQRMKPIQGSTLSDCLTFIAAVIEIDKVLLEVGGQGLRINGIAVILAGDMALARRQLQIVSEESHTTGEYGHNARREKECCVPCCHT